MDCRSEEEGVFKPKMTEKVRKHYRSLESATGGTAMQVRSARTVPPFVRILLEWDLTVSAIGLMLRNRGSSGTRLMTSPRPRTTSWTSEVAGMRSRR